MHAAAGQPDPMDHDLIEGLARVVAVEGGLAWLEPEQTTACGHCAGKAVCGVTPGNPRLVARRFALRNDHDLRVGERVIVGVPEQSVRGAALTTYGIPLLLMLGAGVTVQKMGGGDLQSAAATLAGLAAGIGVVRLLSARLAHRADYSPHYLRRASAIDADCGSDRC